MISDHDDRGRGDRSPASMMQLPQTLCFLLLNRVPATTRSELMTLVKQEVLFCYINNTPLLFVDVVIAS